MSWSSAVSGRCDVLAVARECVEASRVDAGIELPCGPLPWLWLDQRRLRSLFEAALDIVVRRVRSGGIQLALWREAAPDGPFRLCVEAYAEDPAAGLSFEIDVSGGEVAEPELPLAGRSRALLVDDHPARRRILHAQLARLGVVSEAAQIGASVSGASIAGRYGLVWLGGAAAVDRVALVSSLRLLERRQGHPRACVAALREVPAIAPAGIDTWIEWPPSLEQWRRLCADAPPDEEAAGALFFREGRRDAAAIREALRTADWASVVRHAHRIKGGTVVLGEDGICALAECIEQAARQMAPDPALLARLLAELEDGLSRAPA